MLNIKGNHVVSLLMIIVLMATGVFIMYTAVPSPTVVTAGSGGEIDFSIYWNDLPETVTPTTNYYGGARAWELSDDLSLHMCWCYGIRVTHVNTDVVFDGDEFEGHYVWTRPYSNDLILTDNLNYLAMFDYENRITSTFAREGTRSYRFADWSAYFFSDGTFQVVTMDGTIDVMKDGMFLIDPIADWDIPVTADFLIDLDQQFMMKLLIHRLPWES